MPTGRRSPTVKNVSLEPVSLEHNRSTLPTGYWYVLTCVDHIGYRIRNGIEHINDLNDPKFHKFQEIPAMLAPTMSRA